MDKNRKLSTENQRRKNLKICKVVVDTNVATEDESEITINKDVHIESESESDSKQEVKKKNLHKVHVKLSDSEAESKDRIKKKYEKVYDKSYDSDSESKTESESEFDHESEEEAKKKNVQYAVGEAKKVCLRKEKGKSALKEEDIDINEFCGRVSGSIDKFIDQSKKGQNKKEVKDLRVVLETKSEVKAGPSKSLGPCKPLKKDEEPLSGNNIHQISVFNKSHDAIRNAASKIFGTNCPLPMHAYPMNAIRNANLLADQFTSESEIQPGFFWNLQTCERNFPLHHTSGQWVQHICMDCWVILRQKNLHPKGVRPCPFRKLYHDSVEMKGHERKFTKEKP